MDIIQLEKYGEEGGGVMEGSVKDLSIFLMGLILQSIQE